MTLNIPDKFSKLLVLIGLLLIGYSVYKNDINEKSDYLKEKEYFKYIDSLNVNRLKLNKDLLEILNVSEMLIKEVKSNEDNNIIKENYLFKIIINLNNKKRDLIVNEQLKQKWEKYSNDEFNINLLSEKIKFLEREMELETLKRKMNKSQTDYYFNIGLIILIFGLFLLYVDELMSNIKQIEKQNERLYNWCQSCGKSFSSIRSYGNNKDKSLNYSFCKECFKKGKFTNPNLTKEEFLNEAKENLKNNNRFKRFIILNKLYYLDRWKKDEY